MLRTNFEPIDTLVRQNTIFMLQGVRDWNRVGSEMLSFASRSLEEGMKAMEAIMEAAAAARSVDRAVGVQTEFAKRAYQDWLTALAQLGSTFVAISTDASRPINAALINGLLLTGPSKDEPTHH